MASFGYGAADIIGLSRLAWSVYKRCKEAPDSFESVSQEALSLHALLKETEELLSEGELSLSQAARLSTISHGCQELLTELETLIEKYDNLGSEKIRVWDRFLFSVQDVSSLRQRLIAHASMLSGFIQYGFPKKSIDTATDTRVQSGTAKRREKTQKAPR